MNPALHAGLTGMPKLYGEISMSLDGFITGPNVGPEQTLGAGGERLHEWATGLASWRESHGLEGGNTEQDDQVMREVIARSGAVIMGKNMFGPGPGAHEADDSWQGWWGDDPPFRKPVFVLTHHERKPLQLGDTTFTFVTEGPEAALEQARSAAGDKDVQIAGGASAMQQYLGAGLLDELLLHVPPVLLGSGVRLFDNLEGADVKLEPIQVLESPAVTHLRYRVS
jgi:dihydrofolate reductase